MRVALDTRIQPGLLRGVHTMDMARHRYASLRTLLTSGDYSVAAPRSN